MISVVLLVMITYSFCYCVKGTIDSIRGKR